MFSIERNSEESKQKRDLSKTINTLKEEGLTVKNADEHIALVFQPKPNAHYIHNAKAAIIHQGKRTKAILAVKVAEAILAYDPTLKTMKEELRGWTKENKFFFNALMQSSLHREKVKALSLLLSSQAKPNNLAARQVYEIAMTSYQKAIGWNDISELEALCLAIETFDITDLSESKASDLKELLEQFLAMGEIRSSKQFISMGLYQRFNDLNRLYTGKVPEISGLASDCVFKCWKVM